MFASVATDNDVRRPPTDEIGGEDDAHREERVAVALVDAGGTTKHASGEHGQADQQCQPVGPPGHQPQDQGDRGDQQPGADQHRRDAGEDRPPDPQ